MSKMGISSMCYELLKESLKKIEKKYYLIDTASKSANPITRERVFCYELYHQARCIQMKTKKDNIFIINGEPDKKGHTKFESENPDLIFHNCKSMDENYLVIEVKCPFAGKNLVNNDVEKLLNFIKKYQYQLAAFVMFGIRMEEFLKKYSDQLKEKFSHEDKHVLEKVKVITRFSPDEDSKDKTMREIVVP